VSKHPLLISERTATTLSPEQAAVAQTLPEISLLSAEGGRVQFIDGREERDVDNIIFCTGYHFSISIFIISAAVSYHGWCAPSSFVPARLL
jgi:hypothetical protein